MFKLTFISLLLGLISACVSHSPEVSDFNFTGADQTLYQVSSFTQIIKDQYGVEVDSPKFILVRFTDDNKNKAIQLSQALSTLENADQRFFFIINSCDDCEKLAGYKLPKNKFSKLNLKDSDFMVWILNEQRSVIDSFSSWDQEKLELLVPVIEK